MLVLAAAARAEPSHLELTGDARTFAPGINTTQFSETRLTVTPDGKTALWFSRNRPGGPGSYDIWMAQRTAAGWGASTPVPFNTAQRDFDPAFSADGRFVYFCSDRPGGRGGDDIYRVAVTMKGFGMPELLGPEVNSPGNEWAPMPSGAGDLLFSSDGRPGARRMDLFIARAADGVLSAAQPLPGALNTEADEFDATLLADGQTVIFSRAPKLQTDIVWLYVAVQASGSYDAGTRLPAVVNLPGKDSYAPMLDWSRRDQFTFTRADDVFVMSYRLHRSGADAPAAPRL